MGLHAQYGPLVSRLAQALCFAGALAAPAPALAQSEQCRLALLLALDVSASVDADEYALQMPGLASALIDEQITRAFLDGPGPVALSIYEWSGRFQQDLLVDWTMITSQADLLAVAERLANAQRGYSDFPTAIGYALGFAAEHFASAPPCLFQTLDVSGDGQNNDGFPPALAYEHFPLDNVTVNGLAIGGASRQIQEYFAEKIIRGPGAFVEYAPNHQAFEQTMRRKLERELRAMILGSLSE